MIKPVRAAPETCAASEPELLVKHEWLHVSSCVSIYDFGGPEPRKRAPRLCCPKFWKDRWIY